MENEHGAEKHIEDECDRVDVGDGLSGADKQAAEHASVGDARAKQEDASVGKERNGSENAWKVQDI